MPNVGKPRGGGASFGLPFWFRSRLHAGEPRGGLFWKSSSPFQRFLVSVGIVPIGRQSHHPPLERSSVAPIASWVMKSILPFSMWYKAPTMAIRPSSAMRRRVSLSR